MVRVLGKSNSAVTMGYDKIKSEIIDSEKAKRASQALNFQDNLMSTEFQQISPARCQSETDMSCDSDADSLSSCYSGQPNSPIMNERHAEVMQRRKERRRERNKLSAQAYRQRKREEIQNQDKVVTDLEEEQKRLQDKVAELEHEKSCVENFLRNRVQFLPWFPTNNNCINNNPENNDNTNHHGDHHGWNDGGNEKHYNQINGNKMEMCSTSAQGQPMMTQLNNQMVVS